MSNMFYGCSSLTSLNLSNFDSSQVTLISQMFYGCEKLAYINLKNFNEINLIPSFYVNIFHKIPENVVICINETKTRNKILNQIINKKCYTIDCTDDWKSKQKKIINSFNGCECELNNCLACPTIDSNKKICTQCNNNFYPIENEYLIDGKYINCYKNLKGYYLDKNDRLYKKCYYRCETCEAKGDNITHNCLACNTNFSFSINVNNYNNCY